MSEADNSNILILATILGGAGAAIFQYLLVEPIRTKINKSRIKKNFKRELQFNISQLDDIILELTKLKEDYLKLDLQHTYTHYFTFNHSSVLFRAMVGNGVIYDYLNNEQMLKFDKFLSQATGVDYLNSEVKKIRELTYQKAQAASQVELFLNLFKTHRDSLLEIYRTV